MIMQLRKLGCASIHGADHGLQALDFLSTTTFCPSSSTSSATPLSIVLLDVEMPVMGGLACARRIREMEESGEVRGHVPVIGITANARTDQIADCLAAGMDEVLVCLPLFSPSTFLSVYSCCGEVRGVLTGMDRLNPFACRNCYRECWHWRRNIVDCTLGL